MGTQRRNLVFCTSIVPIAAVSRCLFLDADTHRFTAGSLGAIFESELPQWLLSQTDVGPSLWGSRGFASHCRHNLWSDYGTGWYQHFPYMYPEPDGNRRHHIAVQLGSEHRGHLLFPKVLLGAAEDLSPGRSQ